MPTTVAGPESSRKMSNPLTKTLALTFGIPLLIGLMLWAFLAPTFASSPAGVPIAVAGPDPVVEKLQVQMEQRGEHPELITAGSQEEAVDMVENREAVGAIAVTQEGATIYTASGNGAPYTQLLGGVAQQMESSGMPVDTVDLAPTTDADPQATGLGLLGLPLAFGGIISAVLATILLRGHKWLKMTVIAGVALLGSAIVVWMLHSVYGTLDGSALLEWIAVALGISATSALTAGLGAVLGMPGIGLGAVLTIFVSNPLSGLATGPWILPAGWSTLGQLMPIGATGFLVRSISFFDGAGATQAWIVLASWVVIGLILLMFDRQKVSAAAE